MKKLIAIAIAALVMTGCSATPLKPTTRNLDTVTVTWISEDVAENCSHLRTANFTPYGCARWTGDLCIIYAPVPTGQEDARNMAILGHEALHCFRGDFH